MNKEFQSRTRRSQDQDRTVAMSTDQPQISPVNHKDHQCLRFTAYGAYGEHGEWRIWTGPLPCALVPDPTPVLVLICELTLTLTFCRSIHRALLLCLDVTGYFYIILSTCSAAVFTLSNKCYFEYQKVRTLFALYSKYSE